MSLRKILNNLDESIPGLHPERKAARMALQEASVELEFEEDEISDALHVSRLLQLDLVFRGAVEAIRAELEKRAVECIEPDRRFK